MLSEISKSLANLSPEAEELGEQLKKQIKQTLKNESYFLYFEDYDLSLRIGKLGRLAYAPNVRITHCGGNTSSKGLWHIRIFIISGIRFFNKHGWRFF